MATNSNTIGAMLALTMGALFVLALIPTISASPGGSRKLLVLPQGSSQGQVQQMRAPSRSLQPSGKLSGDDPLQLTNAYRAVHGAPPLVWDTNLVAKAQNWANNLASQCAFYHSGSGENLAAGYPAWSDVIFGWYDEQRIYNYAAPGYSPSTGHFTQLVWQSTQKVGCAAARSNCQQGVVWTCEYDPAGNVNSAQYFQSNVRAPSSS